MRAAGHSVDGDFCKGIKMAEEPQKTDLSADAEPEKDSAKTTTFGPVIAIIAIAIGIGLMFAARHYKTQNPPVQAGVENSVEMPKQAAPAKKQTVTIGGPFTLTDHNDQSVTEKTYAGQYLLVFFGYTFCPDVCPTTLTTLSNTMDVLGEAAGKVTPLFISVDPERDTPAHLKEYVGYFHPRLVALTGTPEQIKAVTKAYRVYFAKAEANKDDAEDYLVDHSSITYLMGPDGEFLEHFSHGTEAEQIAERLLEHL